VTITVTCNFWAPSSGDHLFTCDAIYLPPQHATSYSTGITLTIENFRTWSLTSIIFLFFTLAQTLTRHTYLNTNT